MIGTLGTTKWIKTNSSFTSYDNFDSDSKYYFDGSQFEGSLIKCQNGCNNMYNAESSDWCDAYHDRNTKLFPCELNSTCATTDTMCSTFNGLNRGAGVFVFFEVGSMIGIVVWLSAMFCSFKAYGCYCFNYCCSVCSCVFHFIAILGWLGVTKTEYNNSCNDNPTDGSQLKLCATDGPGLALFMMIFNPLVVIGFIVLACIASKNRQNPNNENQGNQGYSVPPPNSNYPTQFQPNGPYIPEIVLPKFPPDNQPPQYVPGAPQYVPGAPQYVPGGPQYVPGAPQYVPGAPQYVPGAPQYSPEPQYDNSKDLNQPKN